MNSALPTSLLVLLLPYLCLSQPEIQSLANRRAGIHLPIYLRETSGLARKRGATGSIGLGDYQDLTYNILVKVGTTEVPLVLDTGSSDLWVISDACMDPSCLSAGIPRYPQTNFQSSGLDAKLFYGDSQTSTHAFGEIGKDIVGVAGLSISDQYFAAINDTNTTVSQTGSAGIFGLGFPMNSVIWSQLFRAQFPKDVQPPTKRSEPQITKFHDFSLVEGSTTARRKRLPDLTSLLSLHFAGISSSQSLKDLLGSFASNGPLLARFASRGALASPQFTVTLQRNSIQIGGNVGMFSVGELPAGVSNDSLTWVPVRGYTPQQGGLSSPTDTYPIAWEISIDDVFLDGHKLPRSQLAPGISVSALIDTGNSLIRGPKDVVQALTTTITGSDSANFFTFACSAPHTLAFQIGGKMFPLDPRDLVQGARNNTARSCVSTVIATDPPHKGFLYSWSLGDPFLKSTQVSFYLGNLTHPSMDPPRIGLRSTVPGNAAAQYSAAVAVAQEVGSFPVTTESAPSSDPWMATTIGGVPQPTPGTSETSSNRGEKNGESKPDTAWPFVGAALITACLWVW